MDSKELKETERLLKALANRRRITMIRLLKQHSVLTVGDIAEKMKLSFKAVSNHLAVLRAADIVERDQVGLNMNYRLAHPVHIFTRNIFNES